MTLAISDPSSIPSAPAVAVGEILIACARLSLGEDSEQRSQFNSYLSCGDLDWDELIRTAKDHGVVPLLHRAVQRSGQFEQIPASAAQSLREFTELNARHNLLLISELLKLIAAMRGQGVRILPFKGPLLALTAYGDLSLRQCSDLDILVPEADLEKAESVLAAQGYAMSAPMTPAERAAHMASPHECEFVYFKQGNASAMVELHWKVVGTFFSFAPDPAELWERAAERSIAGAQIRMLGHEDALLILCAHGTKHFWSRLTWICDIAQFCRANGEAIDWAKFMQRAAEFDAKGMAMLGLLLAESVLGTKLAPEVTAAAKASERRQADELHERLFRKPAEPDAVPKGARMQLTDGGLFRSILFHARMRSWRSGLRYLFHRSLTPNVVDETWVSLPKPLRFLYYFVRPLRLLSTYSPLARTIPAPRLARAFDLPAKYQRRALRAAMLVIAFRLGLWLVPFRLLRSMAKNSALNDRSASPLDEQMCSRMTAYVASVSRFVPGASCLTQALAAQVLLRSEGFNPELKIGVARGTDGAFKAHAWLERDGRILIGDFKSGEIQFIAME